jgi:hypothetical protein
MLDVRGAYRGISLMVVGFLADSARTSKLFILIDLSNFVNDRISILKLRNYG